MKTCDSQNSAQDKPKPQLPALRKATLNFTHSELNTLQELIFAAQRSPEFRKFTKLQIAETGWVLDRVGAAWMKIGEKMKPQK